MQIIPIETSKLKLHNTFKTPGKMCVCVCVIVFTFLLSWLLSTSAEYEIFRFIALQLTFKSSYSLTYSVRTVYVTQARRNAMGVGLVFEADLNMTSHASHWVLQGVCLCLNTDA